MIDTQRLESTYAALSEALDAVEPGKERVFLAKLALMLAIELHDQEALIRCINICKSDL
jgi:hypothetical protein